MEYIFDVFQKNEDKINKVGECATSLLRPGLLIVKHRFFEDPTNRLFQMKNDNLFNLLANGTKNKEVSTALSAHDVNNQLEPPFVYDHFSMCGKFFKIGKRTNMLISRFVILKN